MKESTKYLILFIMDIFLIIAWPTLVLAGAYSTPFVIFMIGALWCNDIYEAFRHWANYKFYK